MQESSKNTDSLPVSEVIAIVREWVALEASLLPNFAGAYMWGGITSMEPDVPFALWRDVDVVVVVMEGAPEDEGEVFYGGLSIEIIWKNLDEHHDVEAALANPSAGPNLATTTILADPTGALTRLQQGVAKEFAQRRWIAARTAKEQARSEEALAKMRVAETAAERLASVIALLMGLSGGLAVAQLARPTTRRTLALLGELLDAQGLADLHEQALLVMGSATMGRDDVLALLDLVMTAYTRAVQVYSTHIHYGFTLRDHLMPYYREGTLEMVAEGKHREAVFWLALFDIPFLALANDAPEDEKGRWGERFHDFYAAMGLADGAGWPERVALAESLTREIGSLADAIVASQPE